MRQVHARKRRLGSRTGQQPRLPIEARDPDIVHAHQIARRAGRSRADARAREDKPGIDATARVAG
jgi:hypothetical protein